MGRPKSSDPRRVVSIRIRTSVLERLTTEAAEIELSLGSYLTSLLEEQPKGRSVPAPQPKPRPTPSRVCEHPLERQKKVQGSSGIVIVRCGACGDALPSS